MSTGRQKIQSLIDQLKEGSENDMDLGMSLLERANDGLYYAQALQDILPTLTDEECEEAALAADIKDLGKTAN